MSTGRVRVVAAGAVGAAVCAAAGFAIGAGATGMAPSAGAGWVTFTDPSGDGNGGPDVTAVTVGYTQETGLIEVAVTAVALRKFSNIVFVHLDTDRNAATGTGGAEYALRAGAGRGSGSWDVQRWTGAAFESIKQSLSSAASYSQAGETFRWRIGKADLGGTEGFDFRVVTLGSDDGRTFGGDAAPNQGTGPWRYELAPPPPTTSAPTLPTTTTLPAFRPLIGKPATNPHQPTAGRRLVLTFRVTRSDTGAPVTRGRMICTPTLRGEAITHRDSFSRGIARLSLTIPKSAKGSFLTVTIRINTDGTETTRRVRIRVA